MVVYKITFHSPGDPTKHSFECPDDEYLLDAAEEAGFDWPYSSRSGADSTSAAKLISGQVDQSDQSFLDDEQIEAGYILTDTSYPKTDCELITHQEDELY